MTTIEGFPLSPHQLRCWQSHQSKLTHRVDLLWEGPLHGTHLKQSLLAVMAPHAIFRTQFHLPLHQTSPLQVFTEKTDLNWTEADTTTDALENLALWQNSVLEEASTSRETPQIAVMVLKNGTNRYRLRLILNPILGDGQSALALVKAWIEHYHLGPSPKEEEVFQYVQYSEWLTSLEAEDDQGAAWWDTYLNRMEKPQHLPFCRSSEHQPQWAFVEQPVSDELRTRLEAFAKGQNTSSANILGLLWGYVFSRWANLGTWPMALGFHGRTFAELSEAMGPFHRNLPLHFHVRKDHSFSSHLAEWLQQTEALEAWQHYFGLGHIQLPFQPHVGFESYAIPDIQAPPHTRIQVLPHFQTRPRGLTLRWFSGQASHLSLNFDQRQYDALPIADLLDGLLAALETVLQHPQIPLKRLPLLAPEKKTTLLEHTLPPERHPFAPAKPLHHIFESHATRQPDKIAIRWGVEEITYADLNHQANRIAHHLQAIGLKPGSFVPISIPRHPDWLAAILGIWKAGGAYLPVDPELPLERKAQILSQASFQGVLTHRSIDLPPTSHQVILLDSEGFKNNPMIIDLPQTPFAIEQPAYCMFTSGSTGRPKGVAVSMHNLLAYLDGIETRFGAIACETFGTVTSFAADLGHTSLFPALFWGKTLTVFTQEALLSAETFAQEMQAHPVDCLKITPSHLQALLHAPNPQQVLPNNVLFLGGEASSTDFLDRLRHLKPGLTLINHYGPTETTVGVLTHACRSGEEAKAAPLGKPLARCRTIIADEQQELMPQAIPGQLYLGGEQVSWGYLGQPGLTAQVFVPDSLTGGFGTRLYQSGDLALLDAKNRFHFLGRADYQVKIRGYRVELGEIEAILAQDSRLERCLAAFHEIENQSAVIVLWLVPADPSADRESLRTSIQQNLAKSLPSYMVPSHFFWLESFPLNANGKIDRTALKGKAELALKQQHSAKMGEVPPETELEQTLANLWQTALNLEGVGREDHFFHLGGHSLNATVTLAKLNQHFATEFKLITLFQNPTIKTMAERVREALFAQIPLAYWQEVTQNSQRTVPPQPGEFPSAELDSWLMAFVKKHQSIGIPKVLRTNGVQEFPLSLAQQQLWLQDKAHGIKGIFNRPNALHLKGTLDVQALQFAVRQIFERHDVLRTTFPERQGIPIQAVHPFETETCQLPVLDLSGWGNLAQRHDFAKALFEKESKRLFRLNSQSGIRFLLMRLAPQEHFFITTMHHIICDLWSMNLAIGELAEGYAAALQAKPSSPPPLSIQYGDYAVWQKDHIETESEIHFWKTYLADAPPLLTLPTDFPRPAKQTFDGAQLDFQIPEATVASLKGLATQHQATLFMALQACFALFLSRYSGQQDVVIGYPIATRGHADASKLIGLFINVLPLRIRIRPDVSFADLLAHVRDACLETQSHLHLPFEQIVRETAEERNAAYSPLFQASLVFQNVASKTVEIPGIEVGHAGATPDHSDYDLSIKMMEFEKVVRGIFQYDTHLFRETTVTQFIHHFQELIALAVAHPHRALMRLNPLTPEEIAQQVVTWNQTATTYPSQVNFFELFEGHVHSQPDHIAIHTDHGVQLSYRKLWEWSGEIADKLMMYGIPPQTMIATFSPRSPETAAAFLAILKLGCIYLPIDPKLPLDRIGFQLENSRAYFVLTHPDMEHLLPSQMNAIVIPIAPPEGVVGQVHAPVFLGGNQGAYAIYTSGSTGEPKGTLLQHQGLNNLITQMADRYQLSAHSRVLQFAAVAFDASLSEIAMALGNGSTLAFAEDEKQHPGLPLTDCLQRLAITHLTLPPSAAAIFPRIPSPLEVLIVAGEVLPESTAQNFCSQVSLHNAYGPTETTVWATGQVCRENEPVTIGKPIGNFQVYILDAFSELLPIGVIGELSIGGVGLASGYLGKPALTAAAFLPHPNSQEPGARIYRTGDLAKWQTNGQLVYCGRKDSQVKLRGFRIELGEIEHQLCRLVQVEEAAVLLRDDPSGQTALVAYIRFAEGMEVTKDALNAQLEKFLPTYMVPSFYHFMETFPRTISGKLDRKKLPGLFHDSGAGQYEAPEGRIETLLAGIWCDVLGLERVSRHDHFFELGGHSLVAALVIARVRDTCGVELQLGSFFDLPVLRDLATFLDQQRPQQSTKIEPVSRDNPLPLSYSQARLWVLNKLEGQGGVYNIPITLRLTGPLAVSDLLAAFEDVVERHETLRTRYPAVGGIPLQVPIHGLRFNPRWIDLTGLPLEEALTMGEGLANTEARTSFDLETQGSYRISLIRLGSEDHLLLVTLHHIAADGFSAQVLLHDWRAFYESRLHGLPQTLLPLAVQYGDYAVWQREQMTQNQLLRQQQRYWEDQLEGVPSHLDLPFDFPRPALQTFRGASIPITLGETLTETLKAFQLRYQVTTFMVLETCFAMLLHRLTHQEDMVIGAPVSGRNIRETEPLIGCFINNLAIRTRLQGNTSFSELLKRNKQTILDAFAHQDIPFELVLEHLNLERNPAHSPLFQVMFMLQSGADLEKPVGQFRLSPVKTATTVAKFDLTLTLLDASPAIHGTLSYNSDLFLPNSVISMREHLLSLIATALNQPDLPIGNYPISTPSKDSDYSVLHGLEMPIFQPQSVMERLAEKATQQPDALALVYADPHSPIPQFTTYACLDQQSNRGARFLKHFGIGPEKRVAIMVKRHPQALVAIWAILKAGGSYLPLDPSYPISRLHAMLDHGAVDLLLGEEALLRELSASAGVTLTLEDFLQHAEQEIDAPLSQYFDPQQLAYLLFTSGSTGTPKAVGLSHQALEDFCIWASLNFQPEELQSVLFSTSLNFDLSVFEIFATLSCGGSLVILDGLLDLPRLPLRHMVTLINQVPTPFGELLSNHPLPTSVRTILLCGEALKEPLAEDILRKAPSTRLINLYGPTEDTVFSTQMELPGPIEGAPAIGYPLPNTQAWVLSPCLEPILPNSFGQLCLGGDSLARGYLGNPAQTALRFVPHPFSSEPGARLYCTGDRVRWRPQEPLQFAGRLDHQVKLRGYRIELGEIENVLKRLPGFESSVLQLVKDAAGTLHLASYVEKSDAEGNADLLGRIPLTPALQETIDRGRKWLGEHLPAYMVPHQWVFLERMPTTPNGKLDRKTLPEPRWQGSDGPATGATSSLESRLVQLWQALLKRAPVGIHDNFFQLGGHSLTAIRMMEAIHTNWGVRLPLATLFKSPTIREIADLLETMGSQFSASLLVPVKPEGERPPLFFFPPAGGTVFFLSQIAKTMAENQPVIGLESAGLYGQTAPLTHISQMADTFMAAIEAEYSHPYAVAGYSMGGLVAYEVARRLEERGTPAARLILIDSPAPGPEAQSIENPQPEHEKLVEQLLRIAGVAELPEPLPPETLEGLAPEEQVELVFSHAKKLGLVPQDVSTSRLSAYWAVFKANSLANRTFQVQPIKGALYLLRTAPSAKISPFLGWERYLKPHQIHTIDIDGNHQTAVANQHLATLGRRIQQALSQGSDTT